MEAEQRLAAEEADAKSFVEERSPDLAARVDGSDLQSFVEARDLWQRRNREEAARLKREREERDRAERERVNALTHTYTGIAQAVQCLASFGAYDDPLTIMRDFETRFVNPPQLMKEFSRERLGAASRFALALIDYMEGSRMSGHSTSTTGTSQGRAVRSRRRKSVTQWAWRTPTPSTRA